jgi:mannose-6-phosphate isomerase-like protein (cupin superfamily)
MDRRTFVALSTAAGAVSVSRAETVGPVEELKPATTSRRQPVLVRAGSTRLPDGTNGPASTSQQTVLRSFDSEGRVAVFVVPIGDHTPFAGAPLHLHHEQDEFLYILEGEFVAEVGGKRFRLKAGDSLLMPMRVPHRWSHAEGRRCGAMHFYTPAGTMDLSWDPSPDEDKPATPEERKADFENYGMTLLGVPLRKEEIMATV